METPLAPVVAPITATVPVFCRLAGIGRSKVYELIATGDLDSILCGGRRLIVIDSWRRLVAAAPRDLGPRPAVPSPAPVRAAGRRAAAVATR